MNGGIFLIQDNGSLIEMKEEKYESESLLQELLEKYPNLLAGDQIDSNSPRRWLLVSREAGIKSEEDAGDRWYVDHLFLDQDAIPTLVEVKRSSDTRIRREVVGQMLDYAANAVVYWPVETIKSKFEIRCEQERLDADQTLEDFLGTEEDQSIFWQKVKTNLQAGKVRLLFVSDKIPSELRRIIEFLNTQMDPAEVLGLEINQYVGNDLKTLVPRVLGQTEEAQNKKAGVANIKKKWDEKSFFNELENRFGSKYLEVAKKIYQWAQDNKLEIWWGEGIKSGSLYCSIKHNNDKKWFFSIWTYGKIAIEFGKIKNYFDNESKRLEMLNYLNEIEGVDLAEDVINRYPGIELSTFYDPDSLSKLLKIFEWFISEIKSA